MTIGANLAKHWHQVCANGSFAPMRRGISPLPAHVDPDCPSGPSAQTGLCANGPFVQREG